jgi:hypothetical protein
MGLHSFTAEIAEFLLEGGRGGVNYADGRVCSAFLQTKTIVRWGRLIFCKSGEGELGVNSLEGTHRSRAWSSCCEGRSLD